MGILLLLGLIVVDDLISHYFSISFNSVSMSEGKFGHRRQVVSEVVIVLDRAVSLCLDLFDALPHPFDSGLLIGDSHIKLLLDIVG